jgi:hypothetical protein
MMQDLEQAIRERAYQLWIEGGRQDGKAEAHWLVAQREVLSAALSAFGRVIPAERSGNHRNAKHHGAAGAVGRSKRVLRIAAR